jgi:hypothetical protein
VDVPRRQVGGWTITRIGDPGFELMLAQDEATRAVLQRSHWLHPTFVTICPGHVGTIYQATNAICPGRGTARTIVVLPDGTTLNDRAIQKVRRQERGHVYVEQRPCALGAPVPRAFESPAIWLTGALATLGDRRLRHRGCHRYCHVLRRVRGDSWPELTASALRYWRRHPRCRPQPSATLPGYAPGA